MSRVVSAELKGISLKGILSFFESFAPRSLSEDWDNTGLLLEPQTPRDVKQILLTNDLTEDVVQEAVEHKVELLVSYHPPIFRPLKTITTSTWKERVIGACIENKIAVYSPHTSWDAVPGGVNDWLASAFQIKSCDPITRCNNVVMPDAGSGRLCTLQAPITVREAVERVKTLTGLKHLKLASVRGGGLESLVSTVAVCAGSGSSVLSHATADLYLTGEMSHHELLDATHNNTSVILCNHSDSERGFLRQFSKKLNSEFVGHVSVLISEKDRDPIQIV